MKKSQNVVKILRINSKIELKFWGGAGKVQRKKGAAEGERKALDFYCESPKICVESYAVGADKLLVVSNKDMKIYKNIQCLRICS